MGGCASKPREADPNQQAVPTEVPNKVEGDNVAQGNDNGGEGQNNNEAPLVDLSEPKEEVDGEKESKGVEAETPVSEQVADLTAELTQTQEKVEVVAKQSEEKTTEAVTSPKAETATPTASEDKTVAPVVTV